MRRLARVVCPLLVLLALAHPAMTGAWADTPAAKASTWTSTTAAQRAEITQLAEPYKRFLAAARTAQRATREEVKLAEQAGFVPFREASQCRPGARLIFSAHDRAVVLVVVGSTPIVAGSRVVAAHHDSPHIDLKGRPVLAAGEFAIFKTIYYGALKKYQWANLPLALVGRIDTAEGRIVEVSLGLAPGQPVFVIPDNAPHSDKDLRTRTYADVLAGEEMDPVAGSIPGVKTSVADEVLASLRQAYGVKDADLVSAELQLVPAAAPADVGLDRGLIGSCGQDDRLSAWCAARAITEVKGTPALTVMAWISNNEEVGSINNSGAASTFLTSTYVELVAAQQGDRYRDLDLRHALRAAQVVSADCCDGVNPLFPQTSEASNAARLGGGVALKLYGRGFNANAEYIARIRRVLDQAGIPWQTQTPKVDIGGGGTIGGFMSAVEMEVIDVGVPLLSMHSPFELSSKIDVWNLYRFMKAFYAAR